ncbi:hypothetical protein ACQB60_26760 [Actinomycetota bacterium Odt1-20B]
MRKTSFMAAAVVAAFALTLTGCGGGDDDTGAAGSEDTSSAPSSSEATPSTRPTPTRHPTPTRTTKSPTSKATPTPRRTPTARPTTPSRAPKPAPSRPGGNTGGSGGSGGSGGTGGSGSGVQGTWYHAVRLPNGQLGVLTIRGTSFSESAGGRTCAGTIVSMKVTLSCGGSSNTGRATVTGSGSGQKMAVTWPDGSADRYTRTKPS